MSDSERNLEIANTILRQMGGTGRLGLMVGAKNFVAIEDGVRFKIGNRSINRIEIRLNGKDLYDMKFLRIWGSKTTVKAEHEDVYADMLVDLFEKETGLYLSFS